MSREVMERRVDRDFEYVKADELQTLSIHTLWDSGKDFAKIVLELTDTSREQSLALTKIEEAVMWAIASLVRNPNGDHHV